MMKRNTLLLFFYFYRQISSFNVLIALFAGCVVPIGYKGIKGCLVTFLLVFMTVGYAGSVYFFELRKKKQLYLFYNAGLDRIRLYLGAFFMNVFAFIPTLLLWKQL
jgi:hypothetical protein